MRSGNDRQTDTKFVSNRRKTNERPRRSTESPSQGAYDYLLKPLDLQKLDPVLGEALKVARLIREPAVVVGTHPDDGQAGEETVGSCPEARDRLLLPESFDGR